MLPQKTITKSFTIEGKGVHNNQQAKLMFHPSNPNSGIQFLLNGEKVTANLDSILSTKFQISIGKSPQVINTVEHLLSALYGTGVSNCLIEIEGDEIPILDGSSLNFVEALNENRFVYKNLYIETKQIPFPIIYKSGLRFIIALPDDHLSITSIIEYPDSPIEKLFYEYRHSESNYCKDIAPARTFGFISQWETLKQNGFALGSTLENTIIFDDHSLLNPPLRFPDEPLRHKVLDFLAALSLLEYRVHGAFYLYQPGHSIDVPFIHKLNNFLTSNNAKKLIEKEILDSNLINSLLDKHFTKTDQ